MRLAYTMLLIGVSSIISGQQMEKWSTFYENAFVWNPALTARWNDVETGITHQQSWVEFLDAPTYSTITFQYPFISSSTNRMSAGAFLERDAVGPYNRTNAAITYAYGFSPQFINVYDDVLTFGIVGSYNRYSFDPTKVVVYDKINGQDEFRLEGDDIYTPNVGFGVFYNSVSDFYAHHKSHYYLGISARNLIPSKLARFTINSEKNAHHITNAPHAFMHVGMRWFPPGAGRNNNDIPFWEPNIMLAYSHKYATHAMASLRFEIVNKFWLAAGGATSGDFYAQAGAIYDKKSMLKALVRDGRLRIGGKVSYNRSNFGKYAGIGYEVSMFYMFDIDTSHHYSD